MKNSLPLHNIAELCASARIRPKTVPFATKRTAGKLPKRTPKPFKPVCAIMPDAPMTLVHTYAAEALVLDKKNCFYGRFVEQFTATAGDAPPVELLRNLYQNAIKISPKRGYRDIIKGINHLAKQSRATVGTAVMAALDTLAESAQVPTSECEDLASKLQAVHPWVQTLPKNSGLHNLYRACSNVCDQRELGDFTVS